MSYGYYRAFNTMLDHVQVLYNMAVSAAKGNRFKELRKGIQSHYLETHTCTCIQLYVILLFYCPYTVESCLVFHVFLFSHFPVVILELTAK